MYISIINIHRDTLIRIGTPAHAHLPAHAQSRRGRACAERHLSCRQTFTYPADGRRSFSPALPGTEPRSVHRTDLVTIDPLNLASMLSHSLAENTATGCHPRRRIAKCQRDLLWPWHCVYGPRQECGRNCLIIAALLASSCGIAPRPPFAHRGGPGAHAIYTL